MRRNIRLKAAGLPAKPGQLPTLPECEVLRMVLALLNQTPGTMAWRNNVGQAEFDRRRAVRFGVGGPGGSDIIGIEDGKFLAVECKRRGNTLTEMQKAFLVSIECHGGIAKVGTQLPNGRVECVPFREFVGGAQ